MKTINISGNRESLNNLKTLLVDLPGEMTLSIEYNEICICYNGINEIDFQINFNITEKKSKIDELKELIDYLKKEIYTLESQLNEQ